MLFSTLVQRMQIKKNYLLITFLLTAGLVAIFLICNSYKLFSSRNLANIPIEEQQLHLLNSSVRGRLHPEVQDFLQKHKVFIALTTSPQRIKYLSTVLQTLDLRNVENILLAIPYRYKRTQQTYRIPAALLKNFPKLKILRTQRDLGPITKLIPAVEYAKKIDKQAIVITIDDDMLYPFSMVSEMLHYIVLSKSVVGGVMYNISQGATKKIAANQQPWGDSIPKNMLNFFRKNFFWQKIGLKKRQFVAGYGGVAYRADWLDTQKLLKLSSLNKDCYRSDDMVISYFLNSNQVPMAKLANNRFNLDLLLPMEHGDKADALSKIDVNEDKYFACYKALRKYDIAKSK